MSVIIKSSHSNGEFLKGFVVDELNFSKTLEEFTTILGFPIGKIEPRWDEPPEKILLIVNPELTEPEPHICFLHPGEFIFDVIIDKSDEEQQNILNSTKQLVKTQLIAKFNKGEMGLLEYFPAIDSATTRNFIYGSKWIKITYNYKEVYMAMPPTTKIIDMGGRRHNSLRVQPEAKHLFCKDFTAYVDNLVDKYWNNFSAWFCILVELRSFEIMAPSKKTKSALYVVNHIGDDVD